MRLRTRAVVGAGEINKDDVPACSSPATSPMKRRRVLGEVSDNQTLSKADFEIVEQDFDPKHKTKTKKRGLAADQENEHDDDDDDDDDDNNKDNNSNNEELVEVVTDDSVIQAGQIALAKTQDILMLPQEAGLDIVLERLENVMEVLDDVVADAKDQVVENTKDQLVQDDREQMEKDVEEQMIKDDKVQIMDKSDDLKETDKADQIEYYDDISTHADNENDLDQVADEVVDGQVNGSESRHVQSRDLSPEKTTEAAHQRHSEVAQGLGAIFLPPTLEEAVEDPDESSIFDIIGKATPRPAKAGESNASHAPPAKRVKPSSPSKRISLLRKSLSPQKALHTAATASTPQKKVAGIRSSLVRKSPAVVRESHDQARGKVSTPRSSHKASAPSVQDAKKVSTISALRTPPALQKSSRPLTKPTFQLPSDAITAKLKLQREERLRRQEEEAKLRMEFKARPAPRNAGPIDIKQNTTSRLRMSVMTGERLPGSLMQSTRTFAHSVAPKKTGTTAEMFKKPVRRDQVSAIGAHQQPGATAYQESAVTAAQRLERGRPETVPATVDEKSATTKGITQPTTARLQQNSRLSSTVMSARPVHRPDGKEVFNRDRVELEERERVMREKAEAVKKAREAATERGRQLSREWAEKKRAAEKKKEEGVQ